MSNNTFHKCNNKHILLYLIYYFTDNEWSKLVDWLASLSLSLAHSLLLRVCDLLELEKAELFQQTTSMTNPGLQLSGVTEETLKKKDSGQMSSNCQACGPSLTFHTEERRH